MVHETRVIPLDGRRTSARRIGSYMGDARGHWEGDTLVVETTNIREASAYRNASANLKITERFKPVDADTLDWTVRFDDPATWTGPWTFEMPLKRKADAAPFEYACHEGNHGLQNILSAARAGERNAAGAREALAQRVSRARPRRAGLAHKSAAYNPAQNAGNRAG